MQSMTDDGEDSTSQSMSPDSMDEERPLKKARYVWQIKGRYRLHNTTPRGRAYHQTARASCSAAQEDPLGPALGRWQTRQMARAVVDNTINQVLEDMGFVPGAGVDSDELISLDIFPSGNAHNREGIENQAVLMAIQSHGLQKPCHCSHPHTSSVSTTSTVPFHHRPSTSEPQETDFLAQAVAVAIQKKGLGSYSPTDNV